VTFPEPLWPGTQMRTFLILHPSEEIIDVIASKEGHVEFLHAYPITQADLDLKTAHGLDALLLRWQEKKVPFWDPGRK